MYLNALPVSVLHAHWGRETDIIVSLPAGAELRVTYFRTREKAVLGSRAIKEGCQQSDSPTFCICEVKYRS